MTSEPARPDVLPAPSSGPVPASGRGDDTAVMPLVDHLAELRNRIIWSVVAVAVGSVVGYFVSAPLIEILKAPLPANIPLIITSPGDAFAIRLQMSLVIGVILAMPVLLWHVGRFVSPGLTPSERRAVLPWIPATLLFFAIGVSIAYVILPFAMQFLLSFATDGITPLLSAREYFGFVSTLFLAFGILMEFPVLLVGLSRVGIVTSQRLTRSRRLVIMGITVFSVVATPGGDLVSPTVLGITLYILFELTVLVIRRSGR